MFFAQIVYNPLTLRYTVCTNSFDNTGAEYDSRDSAERAVEAMFHLEY